MSCGKHIVEVGSIGVVYDGQSCMRARDEFFFYARASKLREGNAGGQRVVFVSETGDRVEFDPATHTEIPRIPK